MQQDKWTSVDRHLSQKIGQIASAYGRCSLELRDLPLHFWAVLNRQRRKECLHQRILHFKFSSFGMVDFLRCNRHVAQVDSAIARNHSDGKGRLEKGFIPAREGTPGSGGLEPND